MNTLQHSDSHVITTKELEFLTLACLEKFGEEGLDENVLSDFSSETLRKMRSLFALRFNNLTGNTALVFRDIDRRQIARFDIESGIDSDKKLAKREAKQRFYKWALEHYGIVDFSDKSVTSYENRVSKHALARVLYDVYLSGITAEEVYEYYVWLLDKYDVQPDFTIEEFTELCQWGAGDDVINW